ncbi:MAG TPA: hypothetical protein VFZ52_19870 [Chryseolinea sp.]
MSNTKYARTIFGISILALGIHHCMHDYLIFPRLPAVPFPASLLLMGGFFYHSALTALGAAILFSDRAKPAALVLGIFMTVWVFFRHFPIVIADITDPAELNAMFMGLAAAGSALIISASIPGRSEFARDFSFHKSRFAHTLGIYFFGTAMLVFGAQHLGYASFIALLIPKWIPGNFFWAYLTGIALMASGVSILCERKSKISARLLGCMIAAWIFLVHIPRLVEHPADHLEWNSLIQAAVVIGGALALSNASATTGSKTIKPVSEPRPQKIKKHGRPAEPAAKRPLK